MITWDEVDGSIGEVLHFDSQCYLIITLSLERQREADSWDLLTDQHSLFGELQVNERPGLKKTSWMTLEEWYSRK